MEKYHESLQNAIKNMRVADHMLYVTFPVIKDKRLLLKAVDQIYDSLIYAINSILQYEYVWKRIQLTKDSKTNYETFITRCSKHYNITPDEVNDINTFISIVENHKKSPMEFMRKERVVIMTDSLKTSIIDSEKLKKYLNLSKKLIEKAKFGMNIQT